jgi:hypothetical protein
MTMDNVYQRLVEVVSCQEKKDISFFMFDDLRDNNLAVRLRCYLKCITEIDVHNIAVEALDSHYKKANHTVEFMVNKYGIHYHVARRINELILLGVRFPFIENPSKVIISIGAKTKKQAADLLGKPYGAKGGAVGIIILKEGVNRMKEEELPEGIHQAETTVEEKECKDNTLSLKPLSEEAKTILEAAKAVPVRAHDKQLDPYVSKEAHEFLASQGAVDYCYNYVINNHEAVHRVNGNRPIIVSHVKKLKESIRERYIPKPLTFTIFDKKLSIADGQNRFYALKELKYPVYFNIIEGLTIHDILRLNSNGKMWTSKDCLDSYAYLNENPSYRLLKDFSDTHRGKIRFDDFLAIVKGVTPGAQIVEQKMLFRKGLIEIDETCLEKAKETINMLKQFQPYIPKHWSKREFFGGLKKVMCHKEFSMEVMLYKVDIHRNEFAIRDVTSLGYQRALEEIYNKPHKRGEKFYGAKKLGE